MNIFSMSLYDKRWTRMRAAISAYIFVRIIVAISAQSSCGLGG